MWVADLTEHWTDEGKLYCCAIKDLCSNRTAGWALDSRMKAWLVVAAIETAVVRHGVVGSIDHAGSAGDNVAMESFLALLQKNVLDLRYRWPPATTYPSRSQPGSNAPTTNAEDKPPSAD